MHRPKKQSVNYLAVTSDIMSGLVFVFVILIVIMSLSYKQKIDQYNEITKFQAENQKILNNLLDEIDRKMKNENIKLDIDKDNGVIRLNNKSINFKVGEDVLNGKFKDNLIKIAEIFNNIIPCYSSAPPKSMICDPNVKGKIGLIFIEGHTDNVPLGPSLRKKYTDNMQLSTLRANYTYRIMTENFKLLANIKNTDNYPLISVSGYGENRPVPGHSHQSIKADVANRRIDIRFLMTIPKL